MPSSSSTPTTTKTTTTTSSSFPVAANVLLHSLQKGAHLNESKAIVKSPPDPATGRQEVYVFGAHQKTIAVKPSNLKYQPRTLESLTVAESKGILKAACGLEEAAGMDEEDLRRMVAEECGVAADEDEIAGLVARANEPKPTADNATRNNGAGGGVGGGGGGGGNNNNSSSAFDSSQLRQGADRMSQMSGDDIRRQAATMKAMGPAALRNMNPQMAMMTDAQINMAIAQMEAVANNPDQLKMAADQMKNMSESELKQAVGQSPLTSPQPTASTSSSASASATTTPPVNNISKSQFEQASQQMSSMSPAQLKQQASMLRSMPFDTLRRTNPQMANMSDAQINMSIQQLERMADNPDMVKMAAEQMKGMSEKDYDSMKQMMGGAGGMADMMGGGAGGGSSAAAGANNGNPAAGMAGMPTDPSKMVEALLSNPDQLNTIVKTMKQNPEMMKSVLASSMGEGKSDAQKAQMAKAIDSFTQMDDGQLERYLKVANGVQRVSGPMLTLFQKVKGALGVSAKTLVFLVVFMFLAFVVMLGRWWSTRGGDVGVVDVLSDIGEEMPKIVADSEF